MLSFVLSCLVSAVGWYPFQLFCCGLGVLGAVRYFFRLTGVSRKYTP